MKRSQTLIGGACLALVMGLVAVWAWFGQTAGTAELTKVEREYARLAQRYSDEQNRYWSKKAQYDSLEERESAIASGEPIDPDIAYLPELLAFEAEHRGEDVGITALIRVLSEAARGGEPDGPRHAAACEAAERLKHYAANPLLTRAVNRACLHALHPKPAVVAELEALLRLPDMPPRSRDLVRFYLAERALEVNRYLPGWTEELARIEAGELEPPWPNAAEYVRQVIAGLPPIDTVASQAEAALATLRGLAADEDSPRPGRLEWVDAQGHVARVVEAPDDHRVADLAAALLFKEQQLTVNSTAPALEVELLDGSDWRMTDHRGKVVVIQFSFTGCGPCERMYSDLVDLAEEHGDRLEILTLMRDETPEHVEPKVADGRMTWSIAIDGNPGRVTRRWSVVGFPEVYVIDQQGQITAIGVRGDSLRNEIGDLLSTAG